MKKQLFLLAIGVIAISSLFAQPHRGQGLYFKMGCAIPIQQFHKMPDLVIPGENSFYNAGGAEVGMSLGVKYNYAFKNTSIENSGIGVFAAAEFMWNQLRKSLRKQYDKIGCTKPEYYNIIPIMAGISYATPGNNVRGWVEYGVGPDILVKTKEGWKGIFVKYKPTVSCAMQGGVGIQFGSTGSYTAKGSLGVHYYWLGKQNVTVKPGNVDVVHTSSFMKSGVLAVELELSFSKEQTYFYYYY